MNSLDKLFNNQNLYLRLFLIDLFCGLYKSNKYPN